MARWNRFASNSRANRLVSLFDETDGLGHKVVTFRYARSPVGSEPVMGNSCLIVTSQLEEMGANGVEAMMAAQPSIGVERAQQIKTRGRSVHHRSGDRMVEHHHRIAGHPFQEIIQRQ